MKNFPGGSQATYRIMRNYEIGCPRSDLKVDNEIFKPILKHIGSRCRQAETGVMSLFLDLISSLAVLNNLEPINRFLGETSDQAVA